MSFDGFSEEDLKRIKFKETKGNNDVNEEPNTNLKKINNIGFKPKRFTNQYKLPILQRENSDDNIDSTIFDKCKLSIKSPIDTRDFIEEVKEDIIENSIIDIEDTNEMIDEDKVRKISHESMDSVINGSKPDIVKSVDVYDHGSSPNKVNIEELQMKQRIIEEQNKKRKEMLAKALADRTKQTEEEVMRLEKIKKELQVLDGQFSQDVAVLRKKIDQACWSYAEAEKNYLKVEKEFLQAKINFQKEKEKKELLTEHLCALITHNETRKAQKLEELMVKLASDRKASICDDKVEEVKSVTEQKNEEVSSTIIDDEELIIDGVDQKTGKIVEINIS